MVFLEMGIPAKGLWVSVCVCTRACEREGNRGRETTPFYPAGILPPTHHLSHP